MSNTLRVIFGSVSAFAGQISAGTSIAQGYQAGTDFVDYVSAIENKAEKALHFVFGNVTGIVSQISGHSSVEQGYQVGVDAVDYVQTAILSKAYKSKVPAA